MPNRADATSPADFPWSCAVGVDAAQARQRHIDNVALAQIFHQARLALNLDIIRRMEGEEHFSDQMIARISTDFSAEVHFEPALQVFARISRVGRTSYAIDLAIFVGEMLAVRCETVNVWVHEGRPCPISEEGRIVLAALA